MTTKDKCVVAELVGEVLLGGAIATCLNKTVIDKCDKSEKTLVVLGGLVGSFTVGRAFAKTFYKFCDEVFDTDFSYEIDNL